MKKFKKVVPALCALLVSAVMLGSSTYAWFSMNTSVTAQGMQVSAKSDSQYFVVASTLTAENKFPEATVDKVDASLTQKGVGDKNDVYPVSKVATATDIVSEQGAGKYTNGDTVAVGDWFTASSPKRDKVKGDDTNDKLLKNVRKIEFGAKDYFLQYTFYVGLEKNSSDYSGKVKINAASDNAAAKVACKISLLALPANTETLDQTFESVTTADVESTGTYDLTKANSSVIKVVVYVYIDGEDAQIKSDGFTTLTGNVTLTVKAA